MICFDITKILIRKVASGRKILQQSALALCRESEKVRISSKLKIAVASAYKLMYIFNKKSG